MFAILARLLKLTGLILRHILLPLLQPRRRRRPDWSWAVQLRVVLQGMGGTFVKLGQALALRFDILPPSYCYELFKLLNAIEPFAYEHVEKTIVEDLGDVPEKVFRSFETKSFAAASIGQVHRAVLHTGEKVAVKIQRPKVRRIIATDLKLMYMVSGVVDITGLLGATRSRRIIDEFARWTDDELDYRVEARHGRRLYDNAHGDKLEKNARVFMRYSSERVLTTELIEGIPLIEILYAIGEKNEPYLRDLEERGYDLSAIASHIAWNLLNQVYGQGYFHADLHPANLFVLPGNAIGYVDFGITGTLPSEVRESLMYYARSLFRGDTERAVSEFMRWVAPSEKTDIHAARTAMIRALDEYLATLRTEIEDDEEPVSGKIGHAQLQINLVNSIRQHRMEISPHVVAYMKALITADAVLHEILPEFDLQWHENKFFGKMLLDYGRSLSDPRKIAAQVMEARLQASRLMTAVIEATSSTQSATSLISRVRYRLRMFGLAALVAGGALYFVLTNPTIRAKLEDYRPVPILVVIIVASLIGVLHQSRQLPESGGGRATRAQAALRGRFGMPSD